MPEHLYFSKNVKIVPILIWILKGDYRFFYYNLVFGENVLWLVTHLCLTLCNPMDYSLPGSSVHGILQARTLEWNPGTEPRSPAL